MPEMTQSTLIAIQDLPLTPVDTHSPVPLYHQIHQDLKRLILSGILPAGALMPAEMEFCRAYGVGRQTMRMAIAGLVDEHLVERFAGRGTFVKGAQERMKFYLDRSFTQQMLDMGYQPSSQVLSISTSAVDASCPEPLRDKRGAGCLKLVRLRLGDGEPVSLQSTVILAEECPGLAEHDFSRESLYDVLAKSFKLPIAQIHHVVRAVAASDEQAALLQVSAGVPLLGVDTTAYLEDGRVIECTASHYRADKYEYSTTHIYRK